MWKRKHTINAVYALELITGFGWRTKLVVLNASSTKTILRPMPEVYLFVIGSWLFRNRKEQVKTINGHLKEWCLFRFSRPLSSLAQV